MDFLSEYGLFLAKGLTILALFLGAAAGLRVMLPKAGAVARERIEVRSLNQKYEGMADSLRSVMLAKRAFRRMLKQRRRRSRDEERDQSSADRRRRRVFVLDFHGNIMASAVSSLREEITAILSVAEPSDEVVLRLESSGGLVHSYGLASSQLVRIKDKGIPLTVVVDRIAASGGYMMACVADRLIAAPFAVIGSIGVVSQLPNFHRLLKNHEVDFEQFMAGEYKRTVSLFGETTETARVKLQEEVDNAHALFKTFVKTHRESVELEEVATGEHWFGTRALELNLVDDLRTSDDYLLDACESAELFQISYLEKKRLLAQLSAYTADRLGNHDRLPLPRAGVR
ncbi:MAG: protease SohB [Pseudomonadota bacterium]